jgi:uncharacterized membrane protein
MTDAHANTPARPVESDLRLMAAMVYGLYLFTPFAGITALIGVVLAYVKRGDARGTVYESHFSNAITVFWVSFIACILFAALAVQAAFGFLVLSDHGESAHEIIRSVHWLIPAVPAFLLVGGLLWLWLFYRVVRGLIHVLEDRPY